MRRIFDFKIFVINEKRAPFDGNDPIHGKMHQQYRYIKEA